MSDYDLLELHLTWEDDEYESFLDFLDYILELNDIYVLRQINLYL